MILYFDKYGRPLGTFEWAQLFENFRYRRIAQDMVGPYMVSTVWMGLTYSSMSIPVGTFETMIFDRSSNHPAYDMYCERYNTLEEAEMGHVHVLAMVREAEELNGSVDHEPTLGD